MIDTNYNGKSLFQETGFIGLNVSGRKTIDVDVNALDNVRDGATYRDKRIPERELVVTGFIDADSQEEILQKYDALMGVLIADPCQIIFSDEADKYFVGMFEKAKIEKEGLRANTVSLQFLCLDPHKYSLYRKEFNAANGGVIQNTDGTITVNIENEGTVDVPVSYELTMNHENGYVGIASTSGAAEFGNIEEEDTTQGEMSQLVANYDNGQQILTALDRTKCITTGGYPFGGTLAVDGEWLYTTSYGSGSSFHGAGGQIVLPTACEDFKVAFKPYFATHKTVAQTGLLEVVVGDESNNLLCDVHLVKGSTGNNNASLNFKVAGSNVASNDVYKETYACWGTGGDPKTGGFTNETAAEIWFSKNGELFEVCFHGKVHQFRVPASASKKAKTINIYLAKLGNTNPMGFIRLKKISVIKNNVPFYYDIPNRYQSGDVLTVDGERGVFLVNGNKQMSDEVLGSTYIKAKAGETTESIISVSSFCSTAPTVKAYIREAWL